MNETKSAVWKRFQERYTEHPEAGIALDLSKLNYDDSFMDKMRPLFQRAFDEMDQLEKGAIANVDEGRMVGHYWLRNPALAPSVAIKNEIEKTVSDIKAFAHAVHQGTIKGQGGAFKNLLLIGIGGSALGPQFVATALGHPSQNKLAPYFFDNTDPDGMERVLKVLHGQLDRTLCVVISKSGGTKETRNGMLEAESAYRAARLNFGLHAVAITKEGSELDKHSLKNGWVQRFPMWDWVGGRTSETSAVGLLPAALQGLDIDNMLSGARACDIATRQPRLETNPAALIAAAWFYAGNGKGDKNMVVLPYKDRLELFSKYLQQLIMESLGKELDRAGKVVNQGLTVFGNKGSTDQHAYVQQLRDGRNDFFALFIEVLRDRAGQDMEVEPGVTSGDYLSGFYLGTRTALFENDRQSVTITIPEVNSFTIGALIALFERVVGLYASLLNVNAYHQPGVEAGKKAAGEVIKLQLSVVKALRSAKTALSVEEIGKAAVNDDFETIFKICEHLSGNPGRGVKKASGSGPRDSKYVAT